MVRLVQVVGEVPYPGVREHRVGEEVVVALLLVEEVVRPALVPPQMIRTASSASPDPV